MTKKEKKTIKKELNKLITEWISDYDIKKWKEYENETHFKFLDIMEDFIKRTLQRFIEETQTPSLEILSAPSDLIDISYWQEVNNAYLDGYNQALKDIQEKQQQWLKENL